MKPRQVVGLDLIRFFAACFVMVHHLAFNLLNRWTPISWGGWVGVHIFFVLSGAVIAYSAENQTAGAFLRSRILRLYPAVWVCATVSILIVKTPLIAYFSSMALWPFEPWINTVYWTLGVEMSFYGLIFLLLRYNVFGRLSQLLFLLAALSAIYWSIRIIGVKIPAVAAFMRPIKDARITQLLLLPDGALFALGGSIWLCLQHRTTPFRLLIVALSLVTGCAEIVSTSVSKAELVHQPTIVPMAIWLVCVMLIVISFMIDLPRLRWVRVVGLMTYPLYLVHNVVGRQVAVWTGSLALGVASSLILALLITLWLEPPVKRGLAAFLDRIGLSPKARSGSAAV